MKIDGLIGSITEDQAKDLVRFRGAWSRLPYSTEPVNRDAFEKAIVSLYSELGLSAPKTMWFNSPFKAVIAAALLKDRPVSIENEEREVSSEIDKEITHKLKIVLDEHLKYKLADIGSSMAFPISLEMEARSDVLGTVNVPLGNDWDSTKALVMRMRQLILQANFGPYGIGNYGFLDYCMRSLGLNHQPKTKLIQGIFKAACAGIYWTFEKTVVASERPSRISLDGGKVHDPHRPAIEFADGFSVYCWRGQRVPPEAIQTDGVTWGEVVSTTEKDLQDALAEVKALKWSEKNVSATEMVETAVSGIEENFDAAMAVKRLGGLGALADLTTGDKGGSDGIPPRL